jgi:cytoskeleton protein RodZ
VFEIGSSLREARIRKGIEFPALEHATKIRAKYLRALEDERFELLPAHTYVKGFLRAYADELGLDGELYVDEYNSRYVLGDEETPIKVRRVPAARTRRRERHESNIVLVALAGIALFTALVIAAWRFGGPEHNRVRGLGEAGGAAPTRKAVSRAPTRVTIWARRGDTGLEVRGGSPTGKVLYSGTLERGQAQTFRAARLYIRVGKPALVRIGLNGKRVGLKPQWAFYIATPRGCTRFDPSA